MGPIDNSAPLTHVMAWHQAVSVPMFPQIYDAIWGH